MAKVPIPDDLLLHAPTREEWRAWLKKNYRSQTEVWLVYNKAHTGEPRVAYNDAVEEALCFGWIDGTVRTISDYQCAQRFSVRKPRSTYSQANLERLRYLVEQGKVAEDVLPTLPDFSMEDFEIPPDILQAIRASKKAWANFQEFPDAYVRIRVAFIDSARNRPDEFKKRLNYFLRMSEKNKLYGFGGIEKHF